ncbi:MAG: ABC transporter ATP-binding protein [Candidatus Eisenbacteria bacterium]|nr:ABC transporter ATP-binding protein [Candidatus Eisenbacteria bacterium]
MTALAIETRGLRKQFGSKVAVADLTLTVRPGEVFGFLGPNGAGKTTSMKMLLGLVRPTAGHARVLGAPVGDTQARARMGFLPEHFLLGLVDLRDAAGRKLRDYSKGMLQRIGLAQALLNAPALVFLDEPTSGLDPLGRLLVRDIIGRLRAQGTAVFLNSHLLSEVEVTCDRVAFVKHGYVVREMALAEQGAEVEVELKLGSVAPALLAQLGQFGRAVHQQDGVVRLRTDGEARLPEIARWLVGQGVEVYHLGASKPSLEALFLDVMGGDERPG